LVGLRIEMPMDAAVRLFQAFELASESVEPEPGEDAQYISIPVPLSPKEASTGGKAEPASVSTPALAAPAIIVGAMTLGATYRRNLDRRRSQKQPTGVK
jgi:hypothetical protein